MNSLYDFSINFIFTYAFIFCFKRLISYKKNKFFYEGIFITFLYIMTDVLLYSVFDKPLRLFFYFLLLAFGIYELYGKENKLLFFKGYVITFGIFQGGDVLVGDILYQYKHIFKGINLYNDMMVVSVQSILAVGLVDLLKKRNILKLKNNKEEIKESNILWLFIIFIITVFTIMLYYFQHIRSHIDIFTKNFVLVLFACLCIGYVVFFMMYKLHIEKIEKKHIETYANMVEAYFENLREFKHEYKNMLMSLYGFIEKNDMNELRSYFMENIVSTELIKEEKMNGLVNIKNTAIKGLMRIKISKALSLGINLTSNILDPIEDGVIKDFDMCKILGILMDNAIEASIESKKKIINIGMMKEEEELYIIISNSYKDKPNISKIFKKGYSTKEKNRGLGLDLIVKLNEQKYPKMDINTFIKDNLFHQEITIKK